MSPLGFKAHTDFVTHRTLVAPLGGNKKTITYTVGRLVCVSATGHGPLTPLSRDT